MTTFDFDELTERRGTMSLKWDGTPDPEVIPMWVADMDFRTADAVTDAVMARASQGIFGYTEIPAAYCDAVTGWFARRHGWRVNPAWIEVTSGVVPALSAVIKAVTTPGDQVIVSTPVYNCFFSSIRNNGCEAVECALSETPEGWRIDWAALEEAFASPLAKAYVLCNPHNPSGRVWTPEELKRLADQALRHDVLVIADEIHGEFVFGDTPYTPFASLPGHDPAMTVTLSAASKAFNIAGLQNAFIIAEDASLKRRINRAININEICDVNPLGVAATIAAYTKGEPWLAALLEYLKENARMTVQHFAIEAPAVKFSRLEGTYLLWADCRYLNLPSQMIEDELKTKEKVWINAGSHYGKAGEGFIRLNIAMPRERLREGLARITAGLARLAGKKR